MAESTETELESFDAPEPEASVLNPAASLLLPLPSSLSSSAPPAPLTAPNTPLPSLNPSPLPSWGGAGREEGRKGGREGGQEGRGEGGRGGGRGEGGGKDGGSVRGREGGSVRGMEGRYTTMATGAGIEKRERRWRGAPPLPLARKGLRIEALVPLPAQLRSPLRTRRPTPAEAFPGCGAAAGVAADVAQLAFKIPLKERCGGGCYCRG